MNDLDMQELMKIYEQGYGFYWKGKGQAVKDAENNESEHIDYYDGNLYIEGDNLVALKRLQRDYSGKIKMIYIDPPYNTKKKFIYNDNFKKSKKDSLSEGDRLHSNWLNMMYPRLKLARNLLADDGVIFISIDDNEQENLKKLCNEIFGENNFIAQIIWERAFAPVNLKKHFSESHDYIVCYSKNIDLTICNGLKRSDEANQRYNNLDNDPRGPWQSDNLSVGPVIESKVYEIITPTGKKILPPEGRCWVYSKERLEEMIKDNRIWFGKDGNNVPRIKRFLSEVKQQETPMTIWKYIDVGHSQEAKQNLKKLFDEKSYFDYPKSINLIKRCIELYSQENSIILDFFSGSATTAHAVMQLNAEDGGNRKYIMVQLPEVCDEKSEAYKAGYKNICEIGKERIRRAGEKIKADETLPAENREKLDIGFKVFKLDSSNIKEWDSETEDLKQSLFDSIDNIKSDRTSLDILYEILLKYGLDLNVPIVENKHFYSIGGGTLLINLDKEIDMEVIDSICEEYKTLLEIDEDFKTTVVLRDSSFADDVDKTNAMKKLEQVGIKEVRSI